MFTFPDLYEVILWDLAHFGKSSFAQNGQHIFADLATLGKAPLQSQNVWKRNLAKDEDYKCSKDLAGEKKNNGLGQGLASPFTMTEQEREMRKDSNFPESRFSGRNVCNS